MSSRAKKIVKEVQTNNKQNVYEMCNCTAGSAICTIGKLAGKKEQEILDDFNALRKNFPVKVNTIRELCDFLIGYFGMDEKYKDNLVLVYDERNIITPLITVKYQTEDGGILCPISSDGTYTGILTYLDNEWVSVEFIYGDDENEEEE